MPLQLINVSNTPIVSNEVWTVVAEYPVRRMSVGHVSMGAIEEWADSAAKAAAAALINFPNAYLALPLESILSVPLIAGVHGIRHGFFSVAFPQLSVDGSISWSEDWTSRLSAIRYDLYMWGMTKRDLVDSNGV